VCSRAEGVDWVPRPERAPLLLRALATDDVNVEASLQEADRLGGHKRLGQLRKDWDHQNDPHLPAAS
jgi:hypothetical protein